MRKQELAVTRDDFLVDTFGVDDLGFRIIHKESGAIGESSFKKSRHSNKKLALKKVMEDKKFKDWLHIKTFSVIKGRKLDYIEETYEN